MPLRLSLSAVLLLSAPAVADPLPNTKPLTDTGDLARRMVDGMHAYLDRELADAERKRDDRWKPAREGAFEKALSPARDRLRKLLGVTDARSTPHLTFTAGPGRPASWATDGCTVHAVRWAVLPGVEAEGLLIEPSGPPKAGVVAVGHPGHTAGKRIVQPEGNPETIAEQAGLYLAKHGCRVLIPTLIDREHDLSANPRLKRTTNIPHREFVHRMAFTMGRTLTGFEVQQVLAGIDWLRQADPKLKCGVIGHGDGGRVALHAAALDDRIAACEVLAAFGPQDRILHTQPLDRNLWGVLREFGDAELGGLTGDRWFAHSPNGGDIVEPGYWPTWAGPKPGGQAAPGTLGPLDGKGINPESDRMGRYGKPVPERKHTHVGFGDEPWYLLRELTGDAPKLQRKALEKEVDPESRGIDRAARHRRQFDQLVGHVQKLWRDSDAVRREFWKKADASSPEAWERSCDWYRNYLHEEVIGKLPDPTIPLNPRSRRIYDEPTFTGYEVVLDVYPDVIATGILLLPKDQKPNERRPVVVCQHGLEGRPKDCIEKEPRVVYNQFARKLVERGYVVYCPQNPYLFENHFRQLQRKANPLKLSLYSFIIRQHQRTLDWLEGLPQVDPKRIAFYGLSYGGKTAMRVPAVEKRYCLSICSGDFNEWIGKMVSVDLDRSYMYTREYEMYEFDLGHTFNYAEMAYLIAPRPFMVERGHDDGVGTDEMVAAEYAKVRYLYANRLKIPDRTAIEFFPGGHMNNCQGTFAFLDRHLKM